ncbi:MAG: diaminopimelate decarboxylase [Alphaproteobacteria bacterium]
MTHITYRDGVLGIDGVPLPEIAEAVGTPVYCYSAATLEAGYRAYVDAFAAAGLRHAAVCYAVKANGNLAVLRTLAALGAGMDVVSEGELRRALAAGVPADRIIFSGVGKTADEMAFALGRGIMQINVESVEELATLDAVARATGRRAPVALRVNPDVAADTHNKISTGRKHDKFGIDWNEAPGIYRRAMDMAGIEVTGIAVHIGSQITRLEPYVAAFARVVELARRLRGEGVPIRRLDFGGGLGITYRAEEPPAVADYVGIVADAVGDLDCAVVVEPGRRIAGPAGLLLARVVRVKRTPHRTFLVLDAAMNDLIRPAMYEAWHPILPVREPLSGTVHEPVDVVGPICESTDIFAAQRPLPPLAEGDLVAFGAAGAYGAAMSSEYNSRLLVPEVLARDGHWSIVRRRPTFDDMLSQDSVPPWL